MSVEAIASVVVAALVILGVLYWKARTILRGFAETKAELSTLVEKLGHPGQSGAPYAIQTQSSQEPGNHSINDFFEKLGGKDNPDLETQKRFSAQNEEIGRIRSERDSLLGRENTLKTDLEGIRQDSQQNQQLYFLLRTLLNRHELLQAARHATESFWPDQTIDKPSADQAVQEGNSAASIDAGTAPEPRTDQQEHKNASRMARVMVADMFLYNPRLTEEGVSQENLHSVLRDLYRRARDTFRARVPKRVWKQRDYLKEEYERAVRKQAGPLDQGTETDSPVRKEPTPQKAQATAPDGDHTESPGCGSSPELPDSVADDQEHLRAARIARVMVGDMFLYNPRLSKKNSTIEELRDRLRSQYLAARETFESRVAKQVWIQKDYLKIEFEKALKEKAQGLGRQGEASQPAKENQPAAEANLLDQDQQHHQASRLARMMIAELLLDNWTLVEQGIRERSLLVLLDAKYQAVRSLFESRVPALIWNETHYFDVQFEQLLWEVQGSPLDSEPERLIRDVLSDLTKPRRERA